MEASTVWVLLEGSPWWQGGLATAAGVLLLIVLLATRRRRAARLGAWETDSTWDDDEARTGFRSSRFAARVCAACSRPMLLEGDGRWRCAGHPACRG